VWAPHVGEREEDVEARACGARRLERGRPGEGRGGDGVQGAGGGQQEGARGGGCCAKK
jgi:hypothetical protein